MASNQLSFYLFLLFLGPYLSSCYPCFSTFKRSTIEQDRGRFLAEPSLYTGKEELVVRDSPMVSEYNLVLFKNGHILVTPRTTENFTEQVAGEEEWRIYASGSPYIWGKYFLNGDSIKIEFVKNISSGGGCKIRSVRYSGHYDENQIEILPGPENEYKVGPSQYILPKDGLELTFVESISDSLIDPTQAKLLK